MFRPSRPMMRPLSSSDFSSTTETVVSTAWLDATRCITAARMLRDAPVGVAAGLLLDLADQAGAVVAQVVLELAHQDLLGLAGAEPGHPLELAQLPRLLGLQLLANVVQVPASVVERSLALAQLLLLDSQRALLRPQPLLEPRDLGAAREQLLLEPVARDRHGRRLRPARVAGRLSQARALRSPRLSRHPRAHCAWALHEHAQRPPRPPPRPTPPITISISVSSHGAQGADSTFSSLSDRGLRQRDGRRLRTLPSTPFGTVAGGCQVDIQMKHEIRRFARLFGPAPAMPAACPMRLTAVGPDRQLRGAAAFAAPCAPSCASRRRRARASSRGAPASARRGRARGRPAARG